MLAVGVDMIENERVARSIARFGDRFLRRIFTAQEQMYCHGRVTSLAGRFALKEAVAKALGSGIGDINWTDVEIVNNEQGKPLLILHNEARRLADRQGLQEWAVSLSHTNTHAIGFAIAQTIHSG